MPEPARVASSDFAIRDCSKCRRRKLAAPVAAIALFLTAASTPLQMLSPPSVSDLIAAHVKAIGGSDRLAAIATVLSVGILNDHGTLHPMYVDRKRPNLLRVRMFHGGDLVFSEVYNGATSWEGAPGKEKCPPSAAATQATAHAAQQFDDALLSAQAAGAAIAYVAREQLSGRSVYHLEAKALDGMQTAIYLDAETYLLDRVRNRRALHPGEPVRAIETVFDDYRRARGAQILVPFRELERDVDTGDILTLSRTDWIEFGAPLSDSAFANPASCS